jgi:Domain of unknown function (DUF4136)
LIENQLALTKIPSNYNQLEVKNKSMLRFTGCFVVFFIFSFTTEAQKITSDFDSKADFAKYKTYAWLAPGDSVLNRYRADKLFCGYITYAADRELKERGMKKDTLKPDAIFVFNTQVHEITTYTQGPTLSVGVGVAGPGYYMGGSAPVAGGKISASTSEDGAINYVMYDAMTGKMVWTGWAEQNFKMSDDIQKIIGNVTTKIFKKSPLKKGR